MTDAVELLVGSGVLVDANPLGVVVGDRDHSHDPDLDDTAHHLAVDRVGRHLVANENAAGLELLEIASALGVDLVGMGVEARRKVDLGARNAQKGVGIASGIGSRLFDIDHVIGR
ncbi:unannotated protein [freshwater metagenome]|uniref:Unannotated protein n=1 Tax=freshwater metagenome TaxID=449393 RepID=A0A6J7JJ58_9ZZZZ